MEVNGNLEIETSNFQSQREFSKKHAFGFQFYSDWTLASWVDLQSRFSLKFLWRTAMGFKLVHFLLHVLRFNKLR